MSLVLNIEDAITALLTVVPDSAAMEFVGLENGFGRIAGQNIDAVINQPPFDRSPLDGYAVRAEDIQGASRSNPVVLTVTETVYAGGNPQIMIGKGEAAAITTGAPIPVGADCVVRQEATDQGQSVVRIFKTQNRLENICFAGEDITAGQLLLQKGCVLDAVRLGVLASQGIEQIMVYQKPRISIISTGDELQMIGSILRPGKIYDSNRYTLSFRAAELGADIVSNGLAADDIMDLQTAIKHGLEECDCLITTGGVSVGAHDYLPEVCEQIGAKLIFAGIAAKPGSPVHAYQKNGKLILGLSGNPFAAYATFELLATPVIRKLAGHTSVLPKRTTGILAEGFPKKSNGRRIIRGLIESDLIHIPCQHSSGSLASMSGCNCFIDIPAGSAELEPGQLVEVILI